MIKQIGKILLLAICLVRLTNCDTIFPISEMHNLTCEFSQKGSIIFRRSIVLDDNNLNGHLKIYGKSQNSNGTVIMKVIPAYGSQAPSNEQILSKLSMNFSSFLSFYELGYHDLQGIFQYKKQQLVSLKKIKQQKKLSQVVIVFYRADKLEQGGIQFIHNLEIGPCQETLVLYTMSDQIQSYSCPVCVTNRISQYYQNSQCDSRTGRCKCLSQYSSYDCLVKTQRILQQNQIQTIIMNSKFQKKHFYYISDFTEKGTLKVNVYTNDQQINTLISRQNIRSYPYVTIANIYNCDKSLSNINSLEVQVEVHPNQVILVTVTNLRNSRTQFSIDIAKDQPSAFFIIKIVLIIVGILIVSTIVFVISCYCCCRQNFRLQKKLVANSDLSAGIFPTIKYSLFQKYIVKQLFQANIIFNVESSSRQKQQFDQQNMCPICLQPFKGESQIKYTYCNHILDAKCLEAWMERQENCPLCRENFSYENVLQWQIKIKKYVKIAIKQQRKRNRKNKAVKKEYRKGKKYQSAENNIHQLRQLQFNETFNSINNKVKREYLAEQIQDQVKQQNQKAFDKNHQEGLNILKSPKRCSNPQSLAQSRNASFKVQNRQGQSVNDQDFGIVQQVYVFYKGIWLYHHQKIRQISNQKKMTMENQNLHEVTDPDVSCKKILNSLSDLPSKQAKPQFFKNFINQSPKRITINKQETINERQHVQPMENRVEYIDDDLIPDLSSSLQNSRRRNIEQPKQATDIVN